MQFLNTRAKRIVALILASILLTGSAYSLLRFGFGVDVLDRSGLHEKKGVVRYLDYFGKPKTGWQYIDGKLSYFNPENGERVSGWQTIDDQRYYFDAQGVRSTGWLELDGKTYYLDATGKMVTGWQTIGEESFYFARNGAMSVGWQMHDGKRSYFSENGEALTGWQKLDGKMYYFADDGYAATGWQELDSIRYCFAEDGAAVTGWYEDETGKYFFDADSQPYSGWLEWESKKYYCNPDGTLYTGWLTEGKERYYFLTDGTMAVGEVKIDGVSNFFTSKGKYVLLCNPWIPVPEDYKLQLGSVEGFQFDNDGRTALQMMMDACREAGNSCVINNTYRSKATQQYIWNNRVASYMAAGMTKEQAEAETAKSTAPPGHSEHQTGLGVDLNGPTQATYDWLAEHCWEYGFILRYPEDKIEITGIMYEPWHFRYVGTELSLELQELGLTMEEYMASLTPEEIPEVNTQPITENQ